MASKKKKKKKFDDMTLAEKHVSFRRHLRTYLVMCGFFLAFNFYSVGGIGWAIWPILGWGIAVAMQGMTLYGPLKDPDDAHPQPEPERSERGTPLPDLDAINDPMELKELRREMERRTYREDDLV